MNKRYGLGLLILTAGRSYAEIYQYTDEHGNLVLTDTPPAADVDAKVIEVKQSSANTVDLNTIQHLKNDDYYRQLEKADAIEAKQQSQQQRQVDAAKQKQEQVSNARLNLEQAKEIQAGDMLPLPSGGIRYTEQYKKRVKSAEDSLRRAESRL